MGRPSDYTLELASIICGRIADGESLRSICRDEAMPATSTVCLWRQQHSEFSEQYARAREDQADALADDIQAIADTPMLGQIRKIDAEGNVEITEEDMLGHRKLQIDARKWIASKLKPKKYGDKIDLEHSGKGGGPIVISSVDAEL